MPDPGLAHAFDQGDLRAARDMIETFIADSRDAPNFEHAIGRLTEWLTRNGARNVGVLAGLLKSQPPQKTIRFTLRVEHRERTVVLTLELGRILRVRNLGYEQP